MVPEYTEEQIDRIVYEWHRHVDDVGYSTSLWCFFKPEKDSEVFLYICPRCKKIFNSVPSCGCMKHGKLFANVEAKKG